MKIYQTIPVIVEAVQWTGNNEDEIKEFYPDAIFDHKTITSTHGPTKYETDLVIPNLIYDYYYVSIGDFIVKNSSGELSICEEHTFYKKYEEVL